MSNSSYLCVSPVTVSGIVNINDNSVFLPVSSENNFPYRCVICTQSLYSWQTVCAYKDTESIWRPLRANGEKRR